MIIICKSVTTVTHLAAAMPAIVSSAPVVTKTGDGLSDSHLSVANLGGDSKEKSRKEKLTFYCNSGGTFLVAARP